MSLFHFFNIADMIRRQGSEPIMVCCHYHNKKRSNPSCYIIEQEYSQRKHSKNAGCIAFEKLISKKCKKVLTSMK